MKRVSAAALAALVLSLPARAQSVADPIFSRAGIPASLEIPTSSLDPKVPAPEAFLGHRIGDRYTTPEQIVAYARAVAAASPRVRVSSYGATAEGRELVLVTITSPSNLARLEAIRTDVLKLTSPQTTSEAEAKDVAKRTPPVVWLACSVHGNEPAGAEAGVGFLYLYAASSDPSVLRDLEQTVIVLDPCVNPDGRARHVVFWQSMAGAEPDDDPEAIEHDGAWPAGRTNHAGFDLNRDWAWSTQPETRARIAALLLMPPQVYVDLHEMGSEQSYFFPPDAEPVHAGLSQSRKWAPVFGKANATAFDQRGWSYFVRETFDLFYPAYGDSWPAFHGALGMTYEVSASGGLAYKRKDGAVLTLKERALKHFTAMRTTVRTARENGSELLTDFAAFFRGSLGEARPVFVLPSGQDPARLEEVARTLSRQGVRVSRTTKALADLPEKGKTLPAGSLVVDTSQPYGRFAEALLEKSPKLAKEFIERERGRFLRDERDGFYDVTAWSLPLSLGLSATTVARQRISATLEAYPPERPIVATPAGDEVEGAAEAAASAFGWLLPSSDSRSRLLAGRLLAAGVRVSMTTKPAVRGDVAYPAGSVLVRRGNNAPDVARRIAAAAREAAASPIPLASAWTDSGPALGSETVVPIKPPKVVLLTGEGVDITSSGALRYALEQDLGLKVTRRRASDVGASELAGVTAIVIPPGGSRFRRDLESERNAAALKRFVEGGGVVVGVRSGAEVLRGKSVKLSEVKTWEPPKEKEGEESAKPRTDAKSDKSDKSGPPKAEPVGAKQEEPREDEDLLKELDRRPLGLPGAALRTKMLEGHPLMLGLPASPAFLVEDARPPKRLPGARTNVVTVESKDDPLLAGFAWKEALDRWKGAAVVQVEESGGGTVVSFAADPVFRGFWRAPEAILFNAVVLLPSLK